MSTVSGEDQNIKIVLKKFVAVRTKYYKSSKSKSLEWHVRRDNKNKNTASVFDEHSHNNLHKEIRSRTSCRAEYKELNGRKTRSDFNEIFEHLLKHITSIKTITK